MEIVVHETAGIKIAEVLSEGFVITNAETALDLLGNLYYQDMDRIIIHEKNVTPDFFALKTGLAGEVLQKFSNYRVRLAIVGDFANRPSKSLNDFIMESNKGGHISFVDSSAKAIEVLSKQ